jgi:hypothetical protein
VIEREFGVPWLVGFDHLVENGEQFSHGGGDDHLERFAGLFELPGVLDEAVVVADGVEGGHVEGRPDVGAAASDVALAFESSGVVVQRCDSGELGDLPAVKGSEFGKSCHEVVG